MNDWPETNANLILRIKDPQNAVAPVSQKNG